MFWYTSHRTCFARLYAPQVIASLPGVSWEMRPGKYLVQHEIDGVSLPCSPFPHRVWGPDLVLQLSTWILTQLNALSFTYDATSFLGCSYRVLQPGVRPKTARHFTKERPSESHGGDPLVFFRSQNANHGGFNHLRPFIHILSCEKHMIHLIWSRDPS